VRVFVTGATGFIGSAIVRRLLERNADVSVLTREPSSARALELQDRGVKVSQGSLFDPNTIVRAAEGADIVIHAAGIATSRASARALRWTTIAGTENVIAAARHAKAERVVIISSADVTLANIDRVHWDEKRELSEVPLGERARALRLAEDIALTSSDQELSICALRPGWVWGPGDLTSLPHLIREARDGGIRMYGDGRNLVATTYVETLAEAALAAAKSPNAASHAYYISDPEFLELREFFSFLSKALSLPPPRSGPPFAFSYPLAKLRGSRNAGLMPEDIVRRARSTQFDVQRAIADLDFRASVSVDEGMKLLARWAEELGGADGILNHARPLPDEAAIERELASTQRRRQ
jgi:nucleoside-diphosphate-sugar epimerase